MSGNSAQQDLRKWVLRKRLQTQMNEHAARCGKSRSRSQPNHGTETHTQTVTTDAHHRSFSPAFQGEDLNPKLVEHAQEKQKGDRTKKLVHRSEATKIEFLSAPITETRDGEFLSIDGIEPDTVAHTEQIEEPDTSETSPMMLDKRTREDVHQKSSRRRRSRWSYFACLGSCYKPLPRIP